MPHSFLVVDDSKLHHQMYKLVFSRGNLAGSTVHHATNGREGYALLAADNIDRGPLQERPLGAVGEVDVMDWFSFAAGHAGPLLEKLTGAPQGVQSSTQARAFPILGPGK